MNKEFDVIIIGAGAAGIACAIELSARKKRCLVLEKSTDIGGALHWSGGHLSGAGTILQQLKEIEDSPEAHFNEIRSINKHTGNAELIRLATQLAPKTIDWLMEQGCSFAPDCPRIIYGHVPYTIPRTYYSPQKGPGILKVLRPLWDEAIKSTFVTCLFSVACVELQTEPNGKYQVFGKDEKGNIQGFFAANIVWTTGGYGSNRMLFSRIHPRVPFSSAAYPTAQGDAFSILEKFGVVIEYAGYHLPSLGGIELVPDSGISDFNGAWAMVLTSVYRAPREIYLNEKGIRFMAEDEINADTRERKVMESTNGFFWALFDQESLDDTESKDQENPLIIGWSKDKFQAHIHDQGPIKSAPDIHQLAEKCGLPPEQVKQTVALYNHAVKIGADNNFQRKDLRFPLLKSPFYAIKIHAAHLVTFAGIKVNEHLQLLTEDNRIIEGLYAAGEVIGLGATSGNAFCSGMALTPALSFGRFLGQNLN